MMKTKIKMPIVLLILEVLLLGLLWYSSGSYKQILAQSTSVRFAVIGDYGTGSQAESDVANLVKSWNPNFIVTVGDNNYDSGAASTIDQNIGQYYHSFIFPYIGKYGAGAPVNRFFPALGNHDWGTSGAKPYLDYFVLPGKERYYDFTWGPVQFFVVDSDPHEPDGTSAGSIQGLWLQSMLSASKARWKLVTMHHPPYSSGSTHGSSSWMQWPYQAWGATAVLAGHDHEYECIVKNGFPYFVAGLGGNSIYSFATPQSGSELRYNGDYGAMLVDASDASITFKFINRKGVVIHTHTINAGGPPTSDGTPPAVSITSPVNGATVSAIVPVSANATDNVGVAGVQFQLDGASLGSEDTTAPYSLSWNTATTTNGSHTLRAVARDAAGNQTTSSAITLNINNGTVPPPPPPPPPPGGGQATSFSPVADAYVRAGTYASQNFGSDISLAEKNSDAVAFDRRTFLQFDLSNVANTSITKATLKLYVTSLVEGTAPISVFGVTSNSWTESSITWNNQPAFGSQVASSSLPTTGWASFDVTPFVNSRLALDKKVSLMLWDTVQSIKLATFNSRENGSNMPVLEVTGATTGGPPPPVQPPPPGVSHPELVWQNQLTGEIGVWHMSGTKFISSSLFNPAKVTDLNWKMVGSGDFNADGKVDLVWQNQADGRVGLWFMNGTTASSTTVFSRVSDTQWKIVGAADFNGDGKTDLLWQHQGNGQIAIWFMNGASVTSGVVFGRETDLNWKIVATGDFNSDGMADLVWQHRTTGQMGVWFMNGAAPKSTTLFTPFQVTDTNWKIVCTGDFNGDNKPDLVWQNQATGNIGVWFMNGAVAVSTTLFSPSRVADINWKIPNIWSLQK